MNAPKHRARSAKTHGAIIRKFGALGIAALVGLVASQFWGIYLGLFAVAAAEASIVGFVIPGTLGIVAAGGMVQAGILSAPATFFVVWLGVIVGDILSYWLARRFSDVLRKWKPVAGALARAQVRLQRHPIAFVFLSHLSPFLKNTVALSAGLIGMPWLRFLLLEIAAALLDAFWFLGLGFVASSTLGTVTEAPIIIRVVSVVAFFAVISFLIGRGRKCNLPHTSPPTSSKGRRGLGFHLKVLFLLGPWELTGQLGKRVGVYDRPDYRAALVRAVEVAEPGDLILVGRDIAAPWGDWSHVGLIVETPAGKSILHCYESDVRVTGAEAYPMCGKVAIARLNCTKEQRAAMIAAAWTRLGTKFKLGCHKPDSNVPSVLNCVGLIEWSVAQAGFATNNVPAGAVVVPDDVLAGGNASIMFSWQDGDSPDALLKAVLSK